MTSGQRGGAQGRVRGGRLGWWVRGCSCARVPRARVVAVGPFGEQTSELRVLDLPRAVRVELVEEVIYRLLRRVKAEQRHAEAELLLGHDAVVVGVPLAEQVDHAARVLLEGLRELLGHGLALVSIHAGERLQRPAARQSVGGAARGLACMRGRGVDERVGGGAEGSWLVGGAYDLPGIQWGGEWRVRG